MRLTTKSEYSILALIYIARKDNEEWVKIIDICNHYGLSKKYLESILINLKGKGLVKTKRGLRGGYSLARPAHMISLAEVIRQMDGPLAATQSASQYFYSSTPIESEEKALGVFREIRDEIASRLEKMTIKDLL